MVVGMISLVMLLLIMMTWLLEAAAGDGKPFKRKLNVLPDTDCLIRVDGKSVAIGKAGQVAKLRLEDKARFLQLVHLRDINATSATFPVDLQTKLKRSMRVRIPPGTLTQYSGSQYEDPLAGKFLLIKGGTYLKKPMESTDATESGSAQRTEITLSSFYLGEETVTRGQWLLVMGSLPDTHHLQLHFPVVNVSWTEVQEFIRRLNELTGNVQYRLPTNAEWEYVDQMGYWIEESKDGAEKEQSAEQEVPNVKVKRLILGFRVAEWCSDWCGPQHTGSTFNPTGPISGTSKVFRGVGWYYTYAEEEDYTDDHCEAPDYISDMLGFRLARTV